MKTEMTKPIETANPQDFKLSICWVVGASKMTAEFSDCRWLPRIGETFVLPIDECDSRHSWHKFKVVDVIYDFQKQSVRVLCKPLHPVTQKAAFDSERFEKMEAQVKAKEARVRAEKLEFAPVQVEDVDDELRRLIAQIMETSPKSNSDCNQELKALPPQTYPNP